MTRTTGGWIEVPTKTATGFSSKTYVYGAFVDKAITPKVPESNPAITKVEAVVDDSTRIMFRKVIRSAMPTW